MSYESLLTDRCDIYHLRTREVNEGSYGIPIEDRQEEYYYGDEPDIESVKCYMVERNKNVIQQEPETMILQTYLAHFPMSVDIRINDKVVWDGIELKARKPKVVKRHHKEVELVREDKL